MKKYLIYALGLIIVAASSLWVFDAVCVSFVKHSLGSAMYKMYRLFVDHPQDELPIFGSSRAVANFVPSRISPKAFCYGIDGSGMNETLFLVENYLKQSPNGGPIIINLDPWGFPGSHEGGFVADYTLSPTSPNRHCNIPGIRMVGKLRGIVASWLNQRIAGTKRIDNGAILQLVGRTETEWKFIHSKIDGWGFYFDCAWRSRVLGLSKLSSRRIIWVVGPCITLWREKFLGREMLLKLLGELRAMPNMIVIDLYDMDCPESGSFDDKHLNVKGAEAFTKVLVEKLSLVKQ